VVAIGAIPLLISELGEVKFGLLTLIWAVVSYFGLFDLGLGRALTQQLTIVFANREDAKIGPLVFTASTLMAMLGILAGLSMVGAAEWGVSLIRDVPDRAETVNAIYAMGIAMPFIVLTSGFRGILEARHAFGIVNLIRLPMGLFTFLGPLAVVIYSQPRLDLIAMVLVAGRMFACLIHAYFAWRVLPRQVSQLRWQPALLRSLCISGGWMTVSNIVGPLMGYLDRFMVGAVTSAQAVAHYATPQELISKFSIIPSALMAVLFPQFAQDSQAFSQGTVAVLERAGSMIIALCMPVFAIIALFSNEILTIWIGPQFAQSASKILVLMTCGMLVNSIALLPLTWLQATNHSRSVALIHLLELPLFCLLLWYALKVGGASGAAMAWAVRILVDACLLWLNMAYLETRLAGVAKKYLLQSILLASLVYTATLLNLSVIIRAALFLLIAAYFGFRLFLLFRPKSKRPYVYKI